MTRYLDQSKINNENVTAGYDYLNSVYFVTNTAPTDTTTRTTRTTIQDILNVLTVVAPSNTATTQDFQSLYDTAEVITSLSYTIEDTNAYVHTIQINDYVTYPLTLDAEKHKLYIMNTELVFDLLTNERKEDRTLSLTSYFLTKFGINIPYEDMLTLYDLLIASYKPHPYNVVNTSISTPLTFNNTFKLSNYTSKAPYTYTCTYNPNSLYYPSTNPLQVNSIYTTNSSNNTVVATSNIQSSIVANSVIYLQGTTTTYNTYTNTADNIYTVKSVQNNTLTTVESIPYSYTFPYPHAYSITMQTQIQSISSEDRKFTLTNYTSNISEGDTVYVTGTTTTVLGETVSVDGEYTVETIVDKNASNEVKVFTVAETVLYSFSTPTSSSIVYKRLDIGDVNSISNKVLTFTTNLINTPTANSSIIIYYADNTASIYTVVSTTTNTITVSESIANYTPTYPTISLQIPDTHVLINSTNTTTSSEDEFIVDNTSECTSYLTLMYGTGSEFLPTATIYSNINNTVPTTISITGSTLPTMNLLGLYSQVYSEE